ncbi:ABC transporter permease [Clostridium sp. MT-14]|mgnify:CR=1 FL=1|uniref:ABC transporter permease subunit n=1 Tax=Clostridium aromativorans TaxID=2836848 RepID=A0ABS8N8W6_9CLOT|nr:MULTISPECIES: ABC transporter permease subunit [Clostridium]KAA8676343.1 ABC transporter permease subunit [Clostridium sp. HV4-5-A1G]MCC9296259.1 ABC transporter permease subunit [Clostridium aromativorans]CAB1248424.1 Putative aliphatic sulfonates transport permease protein SsuC [Clostridiaceae bacterium BL-3]
MKISITLETRTIRRSCILLFWLFIWELCSLFINNPLILPSPFEVIKTLFILAKGIYFWKSVFNSIIRVISGILISIIVGIVLGVAAGLNKFIEEILDPIIITMKATPVMSIIIIALIWFTSSYVVIFTAILICFPIVYTNVIQGIKSVDKNLIQMASVYRVKKKYLLKDIYLPSIKNYVVSGILMCLGIGWKVSVASEVLSTPNYSIGLNLLNSKNTLETPELFAWTIVVVILSFAFEKIFKYYLSKRTFI